MMPASSTNASSALFAMAPSTVPNPGIMAWISSIQATMENDPGKQMLQDQIRTNGIVFLEDYLDNILKGPMQDPIIELVKTPARRKDTSKRVRNAAAANKAKAAIPLNLICERDKENDVPASNSALKLATQDNRFSIKSTSVKYPLDQSKGTLRSDAEAISLLSDDEDDVVDKASEKQATLPLIDSLITSKGSEEKQSSSNSATAQANLKNDTEDTDELSTVIEDDEIPDREKSQTAVDLANTTVVSQVDSREDTQNERHPAQEESAADRNFADAITPGSSIHKPSVKHFPTIGAPSPFRKSMRAIKEPVAAEMRAAPSKHPSSSRMSWLIRARGAKVTDDQHTKKHISPHAHSTQLLAPISDASQPALGTKRKSGEMLDAVYHSLDVPDESGWSKKLAKKMEEPDSIPSENDDGRSDRLIQLENQAQTEHLADETEHEDSPVDDASERLITNLKRTVQGFSARTGKSAGKSMGDAAVSALAEALAAAEARIAERHAAEGRVAPPAASELANALTDEPKCSPGSVPDVTESEHLTPECSKADGKCLDASDVVVKKTIFPHEPVFHRPPDMQSKTRSTEITYGTASTQLRVSTTPLNSPLQPGITKASKVAIPLTAPLFVPPKSPVFSRYQPQAPPRDIYALSVQPTLVSTQSTIPDSLFDDDVAPWHSTAHGTKFDYLIQSEKMGRESNDTATDESWHLGDEEAWGRLIGMNDDSMSWSNIPTRSLAASSSSASSKRLQDKPNSTEETAERGAILSPEPSEYNHRSDGEMDMDVDELDENIPSIRLVTKPTTDPLSEEQIEPQAMTSSFSSTSLRKTENKLSTNALSVNKKGKEPLRSIQLAAAAAKKQQEEADKRAARLKDFEVRRQQVLQKKAEEEKNREKRLKEDAGRWKKDRDREDQTEKRLLRQPVKKMEDDKRRPPHETDKAETKPPSKDKPLTTSKLAKLAGTFSHSTMNPPQSASKTTKFTPSSSVLSKGTGFKGVFTAPKDAEKGKEKEKGKGPVVDDRQPSKAGQANTHARTNAQVEGSRKESVMTPSEMIELPEITSEYSDSDNEKTQKKNAKEYPQWTQSSEFTPALQEQSALNPDDIFGAMKPLKMEEIFKTRTHRFRARTSSAIWEGTDGLTVTEELEYARRMGYS